MMLEVIARRRPAVQLAPLVAPSVLRYLRAVPPACPLLQSVRVCVSASSKVTTQRITVTALTPATARARA
jgi:hypothetical protein